MKCKACNERVKDWAGSDPKCAFETTSVFSEQNWNCATVSKIRKICHRADKDKNQVFPMVNIQHCGDQSFATFNLQELYEHTFCNVVETPFALWVSWYKNRGRTEAMWLLFGDRPPRLPTEEECLAIAKAYEHVLK